jgi:hypothetical protein
MFRGGSPLTVLDRARPCSKMFRDRSPLTVLENVPRPQSSEIPIPREAATTGPVRQVDRVDLVNSTV